MTTVWAGKKEVRRMGLWILGYWGELGGMDGGLGLFGLLLGRREGRVKRFKNRGGRGALGKDDTAVVMD